MNRKSKTVYGFRAKEFKHLSQLWLTVVDQELQDRQPELREMSAKEERGKEVQARRDAMNHRDR